MAELENAQTRWQESSGRFSKSIEEHLFNADEVRVWKDIIYENAPKSGKLKILDIGTGPGFFATILSLDGHEVTGIDCTPGMLEGARANAAAHGVYPEFRQMDAHNLDFPDDTFDLVVSRNVTWTLFDPMRAYDEWKRVLKPGGRLLFFDANWYMNFFDDETKKRFDAGVSEYREKYGKFPKGFSMYLIEDYWRKLPMVGIWRPQWDEATLWKLGFSQIRVECNLDDRLYTDEKRKLLYGATPMFMVSADKPENKCVEMCEYWNSVALEWSNDCLKDFNSLEREKYEAVLKPYINEGCRNALDIGTGSGFMSMILSDMGLDATGVDMCDEMLEQARYCADKLGLKPSFIKSDAAKLPFEDGSFDMIVCRNATWLLDAPEETFAEWRRVLKPGGRLIYFDANWNLYMHDEQARRDFEANRKKATELGQEKLYGNGHSSTAMIDRLSDTLPFSSIRRPEWDLKILPELGYKIIGCEENISARLADEIKNLRIEATPWFIICAERA